MQTRVPRYNYAAQFGPEVDRMMADLRRMIVEGAYILTDKVAQFESSFASLCGCRFAVGVNTGTDALILALRSLEIGPGAQVITQANTFNATVAAIVCVGAEAVLVDAEEDTFLIDQVQVTAALSNKTAAVIPVHLYGKPTPLDDLTTIARRKGFHIVEDAAQAHGAIFKGRPVGSCGSLACFSFHPSKNLAAAGDAGAVVTNDEHLATHLKRDRALGQEEQNHHLSAGLNSKLDAIQAAILLWKLPHLRKWNLRRNAVAGWYRERLADLPLHFQRTSPDELHAYHLFQIRTDKRDELLSCLRAKGIDAVIRYPVPIHLQPAFRSYGWRAGQFPVAERLARELLALPIRPDMDVWEVDYVSECIREFFLGRHR